MNEEQPHPKNVIEAIARVMAEMGGVPKMTAMMHKKRLDDAAKAAGQKPDFQPDSQIRYAYRSIDQICTLAQPLFGIYGVVVVPEVQDIKTVEFLRGEKQTRWISTTITVKWHIYGPAGSADKIESVTYGQGDDNSDKSINKAMTTAYKNLLLRLLCIGDPKDESDHERVETPVKRDVPKAPKKDDAPKSPKQRAVARIIEWSGLTNKEDMPKTMIALRDHLFKDFKEGQTLDDEAWETMLAYMDTVTYQEFSNPKG